MKSMNYQSLFLFFFILSFLCFQTSLTAGQEVEDESEFNYITGSGVGPEHWGEINEEWAACKNGTMQSPIDLLNGRVEIVPRLGRLKRKYVPANATLRNRGHDIMIEWSGGAGAIYINGTEFVLKQGHWHSPSEHTINGMSFAMEVHLVHESSDGKVAVVGILYNIGRPDSFLSELKEGIESIEADHEHTARPMGVINPMHMELGSRKYYRYMGSLTVPPCTEGVIWTIVTKIRTVSREQVVLLRKAVHDDAERNARPVQQTNNREIQLYSPNKLKSDSQLRRL